MYCDAFYNKGNSLKISGKYDEAIKCFDKAIEIKKMLDDGVKINKIAGKYNMSRTTISKLIKKNGYKDNNKNKSSTFKL